MADATVFELAARVHRDDLAAAKVMLEAILPNGAVSEADQECLVEAELTGGTARDSNRGLLPPLRRVERETRLRARWTAPDGATESFFDSALKKTSKGWPTVATRGVVRQPQVTRGQRTTAVEVVRQAAAARSHLPSAPCYSASLNAPAHSNGGTPCRSSPSRLPRSRST